MAAKWFPCCCGGCIACQNLCELDITSANLYTSSTYLNAQVVGTFDLTIGDDIRDKFPPNQCTTRCYTWDRLNDYTISGGTFPTMDCTADRTVSGVRFSEWTVDLCDNDSIRLFYRFTPAYESIPSFWLRIEQLVEFTIDAVDVTIADLTNGTGVDLSNSYVSNYYEWSGTAWITPTVTFSCSTASLNEPFDTLAGTIKLSKSMTNADCVWTVYNLPGESALTSWSFTGITDSNSDCSTLYLNVSGSYPSLDFDFYSDSSRTSLVASGTLPTLPGSMTISQENSSGISGSVSCASSPALSPTTTGEVVCAAT